MKKRRVFRKKPLYSIIILIVAFLQYVSAQSSNDDIICNACKNGERVIQLASEKEKVIKQGYEPLKTKKLRFAICDKDKNGKYKEAFVKIDFIEQVVGRHALDILLSKEITSDADVAAIIINDKLNPLYNPYEVTLGYFSIEDVPETYWDYPSERIANKIKHNDISLKCINYGPCLYERGISISNETGDNVALSLIGIIGMSDKNSKYGRRYINIMPGTRIIKSITFEGAPPYKLIIPRSVESIEDASFGCLAYNEIKVEWFEPEKVKVKRYYYNCSNTRLIVPIGYKSKYERCYPWNTYDIVEQEDYCDDLKAIKDIFADKKTRMKTSKIKDSSQVYTRKQRKSHKK